MRRRAMKKVSKIVDAKQKAMEKVAKGMKELDDQKNLLVQAVEVRLKEFVDQKNRLVESMNKEIDEFNVMYEEIEAICKNLNMSVEGLLTEGK